MIPWIPPHILDFPDVTEALDDPNGLLCAGGDLSPERLKLAYSRGIFPWFSDGEPILWWSPDPRLVLEPSAFKFRRSLKQAIKKQGFEIRINTQFETLIRLCASTRESREGTWITEEMIEAYVELHQQGFAMSFETYRNNDLVGGLYGVRLGRALFGESMVSLVPDASKAALAALCEEADLHQIELIDCQVPTSHLESLGASLITRAEFIERINELTS
ncbi:MAG: leucyl/phenylalanyl-tRNA--protein transferase [Gammaproteobacteria bacterium]|nr:leucyl/phenylalanyl-tRNA--protein transferase [Gammaproteobacteria bacterium]NCW73330.1 leucyl/phenylalanyl-tRNA--protein transferase [Gammaproteobacteria bacterium]